MKKTTQTAVTTITSEMLMLTIVIILTTAVVVSMQSNVSYYIKNKELVTITLMATTKNGWINFTTIHSGGDPTTISARVYIEYENGTSRNLKAYLVYANKTTVVDGKFELSNIKFGEQFQVCVNLAGIPKGTIHCVLYSKTQILVEVAEKIENSP